MAYKILNVISDSNIGGAGKLLLTFLANVDREEFDVSVVLPKDSLLIPEIEKVGIRTIEVEGIADKSFSLSAINQLSELYKEEKPHIVHTHAALSARVAAKLGKLKVVHTRHSVHTSQKLTKEPKYKKVFPYKHLVGALNNYLSDTIIATSPVAKLSMVETGTNQKKTIMVYNGIDALKPLTEKQRRDCRAHYGLTDNDFICAIICRLEKVKGIEYVLKAAQLLQKEDRSIKILVVGIGSEEEALKKLADELELDNVIFTGFVEEVRFITGMIDLNINASHTETTNLVLLEGLSLGVPAVASDCSGNPFVINDGVNGLLFEENDYIALSKAILGLRQNPKEVQHLGKRAKEIFAEKFDSKVMTRRVEDIYRELIAKIEKEEGIKKAKEARKAKRSNGE
ncbi:MAG: glycosyltransferase [Defluviitaleaceae bacterium]|nr:glycosyltransferase [Defluviitaleaceae bacterium]